MVYAIIDGSEVFLETPSDLAMQSSTWSQYKHHNTVKFLVALYNKYFTFIYIIYFIQWRKLITVQKKLNISSIINKRHTQLHIHK